MAAYLFLHPFFGIFVFVLGTIIGSFLNCVIWRLHKNETIGGRSYCPQCREKISWYDNIPLVSFFILGGRCRNCRGKISWQYPLVEFITGILFLLVFRININNPDFLIIIGRDWLLIAIFIIIFVYDFRWKLIPMLVVWPMLIIIFIFNLFLGFLWWELLLFSLLFTSFFLVQYLLTKKKGIGEGDIWLGALIGLAFPDLNKLLMVILLAYFLGAVIGLVLIYKAGKERKSQVALGPFLSLAAIIVLIWGPALINWYFGLF